MFSLDTQTAWAVGGNWSGSSVVLRTTDGGTTWVPATTVSASTHLNAVAFADANTGWAVGTEGVILHTTDGGDTWLPQESGVPVDYALRSLVVRSAADVVVVGESALLHTRDGGQTWTPWSPVTTLRDVAFPVASTGWIVGYDDTIAHTRNGGISWAIQDPGVAADYLKSVTFGDAQTGYAAGTTMADGLILGTTDGGTTWTPGVIQPYPTDFHAVTAWDATHAWAGGMNALYNTTNGITWTKQYSSSGEFYALHFASATEGWAVGDQDGTTGQILHTRDGGANWTVQWTNVTTAGLRAVDFWDTQDGWAVGEVGTILHTSDGVNWTPQVPPTGVDDDLNAVVFTSATEGWAVGAAATILHTTDGGVTWETEAAQSAAYLYGVASDGSDLWAVGKDGAILKRVDRTPPACYALSDDHRADRSRRWRGSNFYRDCSTAHGHPADHLHLDGPRTTAWRA